MRYLLFLFIFIGLISHAQNGINYQGAATNSEGAKLVNQNISLRTSVLKGSVEGTTSYSETHNTTTNQFGLFNVVIGQGEVVSGAFDSISWGADVHFLKVELDASGGTDYNLVSSTQMMSVPYALYAENAGVDSAMVANMLSGMNISVGNGDCDFNFPDGLNGEPITFNLSNNSTWTIPNGKRFYLLQKNNGYPLFKNGMEIMNGSQIFIPIIFDENDEISNAENSQINSSYVSGILIDDINSNVTPITIDISQNGEYTVPVDKFLFVQHKNNGYSLYKNGMEVFGNNEIRNPIIFKENDIISNAENSDINLSTITGYLVNKNFFQDCHCGSVSSNTSFTDSIIKHNLFFNVGSNSPGITTSDTIVLDFENQKSLVVDGSFTISSGQSQVSLIVQDENFNEIPSHKYKSSGYCASGGHRRAINELNHTITSSTYHYSGFPTNWSYFSLTTNFAQLNTNKIYIYISIDTQGGSSTGQADIKIQY